MHATSSPRAGYDRRWLPVARSEPPSDPTTYDSVEVAVAAAELADAEAAAASQAVLDAQAQVATASRIVADIAARARTAASVASAAAADAAALAAANASAIAQADTDARAASEARSQTRAFEKAAVTGCSPGGEHESRGAAWMDELAALAARGAATSRVEQASSAAVAAAVSRAVDSAAVSAAASAASAAIAVEAEVAAAGLSAASLRASGARAVAAAIDAKASVLTHAAIAAAEARRTHDRLTHDVLHDELTGLANRRLLVDRLTQALARSSRSGTTVAVLFLDLDGFKAINDTLGHSAGDQVLVWTARKLQRCLRETDTAARVGGDEFVIVCEDLAQPSDGSLVAGRLQAALSEGCPIGDRVVSVRASVGIAVGSPGAEPLDLLQEADSSMYSAKGHADRRFQADPRHSD